MFCSQTAKLAKLFVLDTNYFARWGLRRYLELCHNVFLRFNKNGAKVAVSKWLLTAKICFSIDKE